MSRGRPRRRSRPSPLLRPDTARNPVWTPSPPAGEWLRPSQTAPRGPRSAHNTTSCTGRSRHSHPGRCWASCWTSDTQRDALRECAGTGSARQEVMRYLLTWLTSRVCSSRSLPGSRLSQIRCWLERTATPWHTHSEHRTSSTWASQTQRRQSGYEPIIKLEITQCMISYNTHTDHTINKCWVVADISSPSVVTGAVLMNDRAYECVQFVELIIRRGTYKVKKRYFYRTV